MTTTPLPPSGDNPQSGPVKSVQRPHPATPILRGWVAIVALAIYLGREWISAIAQGQPLPDLPRMPVEGVLLYLGIGVVLIAIIAVLFASWYFTRFVIDDDELRIETGALYRQSKRIPFTKVQSVQIVQPLAARIFGLSELVIDAGAEESTRLRYLTRNQAYRFRDYLLVRAHGVEQHIDDTAETGAILQDLSDTDDVIVRIGPGPLLIAALLSTEVLTPAIILTVIAIPFMVMGIWLALSAPIVGLAFGVISHINKAVLTQFNYVLARSGPGVKITRGLTSLTSQSVPAHRIQTLRITQAWPWRPFGLYRVDMDLLGTQISDDSEGQSASGASILIPAGTADDISTALSTLWPDAHLDTVHLRPSPKQARWFRPVSSRTLRYGVNETVAVVSYGRFSRHQIIVPHQRVQSTQVSQGPWQRRLRLADAQIHTAGGSILMVAKHLEPSEARAFAEAEAEASRKAAAETPIPTGSAPSDPTDALGWPQPVEEPDPALGFPHLGWR